VMADSGYDGDDYQTTVEEKRGRRNGRRFLLPRTRGRSRGSGRGRRNDDNSTVRGW
jgi:hypothetical protein